MLLEALWPPMLPALLLVLADAVLAVNEGEACPEGCVCRRRDDCATAPRHSLLPTSCCDRGLHCCPPTGRSQQSCSEYSALARSACLPLALPLIVGGDLAAPGQVPHVALLGYGARPADADWMCGGALISPRWVLTAAHCVRSDKGPARWVRLGAWQDGRPDGHGAQQLAVAEHVAHHAYRPPAHYNDIGLVKLAEAAALSATVRPACLHTQYAVNATRAQACGYGSVEYAAERYGDALRCVWLPLLPRVDCAKYFKDVMGSNQLPQGMPRSLLCATELAGGKDTCQGDSGGPLHLLSKDPFCTYSLVGVTAFGKFCGYPKSPGVYTRVSFYVPWIEAVVWPKDVPAAPAAPAAQDYYYDDDYEDYDPQYDGSYSSGDAAPALWALYEYV